MIRHHNLLGTRGAWGELPFTTQFTTHPAPQGSDAGSGQTSTTWEEANPSMAPDVFLATAGMRTGSVCFDDASCAALARNPVPLPQPGEFQEPITYRPPSPQVRPQAEKKVLLGLTMNQLLLGAVIGFFVLR